MKRKYLTVTALTKYIKRKIDIDPHLKDVFIHGEISNFNHHRRGHMYFTLKDDETRIQAVMFAGYNRDLKFTPENGMSVLIKGEVSVYENFGQYQLYVHKMGPDGIGELYLAFEQLKEKLAKEGLFSEKHKQSLPKYPNKIGIITSPTGAAIQDILSSLQNRYPIANSVIFPALVQGENAADSIVQALSKANEHIPKPDLIILGRGGGSIEDLQAFNEEKVARTIFSSKIPVVSAVGHETDVTISDFVADLRAPTPTGAVMLSVPSTEEIKSTVKYLKQSLLSLTNTFIQTKTNELEQLNKSYAFQYPGQLIKQKEQHLDNQIDLLERNSIQFVNKKRQDKDNLYIRLQANSPKHQLTLAVDQQSSISRQLKNAMGEVIKQKMQLLNTSIEKLTLLSPLQTIQRGFAISYKEDGSIIKSQEHVKETDLITVEIKDAYLKCEVKNVRGKKYD